MSLAESSVVMLLSSAGCFFSHSAAYFLDRCSQYFRIFFVVGV